MNPTKFVALLVFVVIFLVSQINAYQTTHPCSATSNKFHCKELDRCVWNEDTNECASKYNRGK